MASPPPPLKSGYGARPSAAVEQGGSFYVPGLEGSKLRVAGATVLSVGLVLNRVLSPGEPVGSQLVSEVLGALGCAIIFVQAAAQARIEKEQERDALRAAFASRMSEQQEMSATLQADAAQASRAKWAASALLKLTPARAVIWVDDAAGAEVRLSFGRFPEADKAAAPSSGATLRSLLPTGSKSVVVDALEAPQPPLPSNTESAALCVCGDGILAMASEQSAAFTPKQLRYLEKCCELIESA